MLRIPFTRADRPERTTLTAGERRGFRRIERGLLASDPEWFALHCPRAHRRRRRARSSAAVLSMAVLVAGALTAVMPVVLCGVVMAVGAATSHVSSLARRRRA